MNTIENQITETLTEAVEQAWTLANKRGLTVPVDERMLTIGIGYDETYTYHFPLVTRKGNPSRFSLHVTIHRFGFDDGNLMGHYHLRAVHFLKAS